MISYKKHSLSKALAFVLNIILIFGIIMIAMVYYNTFFIDTKSFQDGNKYIYEKGIHTDTELIIFLIAGVFIAILSKIFKEAVKYKEENDYTI